MPRRDALMILLERDAWRVVGPAQSGERTPMEGESPADSADAIRQALAEFGGAAPSALALSADRCLAATIDVPAPQMLRKRQVMRYHLEQWLPWSAEDYVVDYAPHGRQALAAALRHEDLASLLTTLDQHEAGPLVVSPLALLAVDEHCDEAAAPADHLLLWQSDGALDAVVIRDGRPLVWRSAPIDAAIATTAMELLAAESLPVYSRGLTEETIAQLAAVGIGVEELPDLDPVDAAAAATRRIAAGDAEPTFNLRRDELAGQTTFSALGRETMVLKAAAVLVAAAVMLALYLAGAGYESAAETAREQLADVYAETFPDEPATDRSLLALRQAHRQLAGTREPAAELPDVIDADLVLQRVLELLPADLRYRVPEIRVEGATVYLAGEVRSNSDADQIAAALRQGGFEVDPPRTQRLAEKGFSASITARIERGDAPNP